MSFKTMMRFRGIIVLLIGYNVLLGTLSPALAHAEPVRSDPLAGAVLDVSPGEVYLWFSTPLRVGSAIHLLDDNFRTVSELPAMVDASDPTLLRLRLPMLGVGRYTANWKVIADDGDISSGSFNFTVRETLSSSITIAVVGMIALAVFGGILYTIMRKAVNRTDDRLFWGKQGLLNN
jgi:methionine-rich copper-binding protein CopC